MPSPAPSHHATRAPSLDALAALLGEATPPAASPSITRQVTAQLALLLASTGERLALLRARMGGDAESAVGAARSDAAPGAPRGDGPMPLPLQPPPPPLSTFTLDPTLGVIVDAGAADGAAGGRFGPGDGDGGVESGPPTSWVPIAGFGLRDRIGAHLGSMVDRVDALLDEIGITRLQLLLLMIALPLATVFLVEVVSTILDAR